MAWLESLAAKHGAKAEELVTDPNVRTDIAPDWVDKAKIISEPSAAAPAPAIEKSPSHQMIKPACGSAILKTVMRRLLSRKRKNKNLHLRRNHPIG